MVNVYLVNIVTGDLMMIAYLLLQDVRVDHWMSRIRTVRAIGCPTHYEPYSQIFMPAFVARLLQ